MHLTTLIYTLFYLKNAINVPSCFLYLCVNYIKTKTLVLKPKSFMIKYTCKLFIIIYIVIVMTNKIMTFFRINHNLTLTNKCQLSDLDILDF